MANLAAADSAITRFMTRTDALITLTDAAGRRAARELLDTLRAADAELGRRLTIWVSTHGGGAIRFSEASMLVYREQARIVAEIVENRLRGMTSAQAMRAAETALARISKLVADLERSFTGVTVPTRVDEALIARVRPSLLARHATSANRYGTAMIRRIQLELSQAFIEGVSQGEMVERLVGIEGVGGFFSRHRSWAHRIIRTEVAEAQNATSQLQIEQSAQTFPDMQRKILAVLDERTAQDSLGVHGQVRAINQPFVDGDGRVYMRPPSRPNDRETLIPWRPRWPNTPRSSPLSQAEQARLWERNEKWQAERSRRRARARRRRAAY